MPTPRQPTVRAALYLPVLALLAGCAGEAQVPPEQLPPTILSPDDVRAALDDALERGQINGGGAYHWVLGRDANDSEMEFGLRRRFPTEPNNASVHPDRDEIYHILDGSATFVTGGVPADPDDRTAGIRGGETHLVGPGDYVVIPKGTLHWFSEIHGSLTYANIRMAGDEDS